MQPYYQDSQLTLHCGDCRAVGIELSEEYCKMAERRALAVAVPMEMVAR